MRDPKSECAGSLSNPVPRATRRGAGAAALAATACLGFLSTAQAADVFRQTFSNSHLLSDYIATAPTAGQFNDINQEADGGKWTINPNGELQLARPGLSSSSNGAGFTRFTDFAGSPTVLHIRFDFGAYVNSWQGDSLVLNVGKITAVSDYNSVIPSGDTFLRLAIDASGSNTFKFEIGGTQSAAYVANGTMYEVQLFLNKSGAATTYRGPNGTTKTLTNGRVALWVGTTCLFDDVAATNGASSTLTDIRVGTSTADISTWKFDNFHIEKVLPASAWGRIRITPRMLTNELASGDAIRLVDEQEVSGELVTSATGPLPTIPGGNPVPSTIFVPPVGSSAAWQYPLNAVIDLGADYNLTHVCLFDANGTGPVTVSSGTPFNWTPMFPTYNQGLWNVWLRQTVSVTTRYVQVSIGASTATPPEFLFYGTPVSSPSGNPPVPTLHTPPTMDKLIGANTIGSVPLHRMEAVGMVREYRRWAYCEGHTTTGYPGYPNNENGFAPAWTSANYDVAYTDRMTVGLETLNCVQMSVPWLTPALSDKPIKPGMGLDAEAPASYVEHADHLFQTVARYGNASVLDGLLKLRVGNPRLSGMNLFKYYENWNEQNAWWVGRTGYFRPYEYAAMSSADGDGHLNAMGSTVGIWNADPSAKFVMAGLAAANPGYIQALKFWCDYKRGGDFAWDVLNVHHYSNDGGGQFAGTVGVSPEQDALKERMRTLREYRDQYLPGKEVWISEFGYDTNAGSRQRAPAIGAFPAEEVQGQWLVRSFLEIAASGIDRAQMFTLANDSVSAATGVYATSGLITHASEGYLPKIAWWYIYTMKNQLAGLRFESEQKSNNANVKIYRFKNASNVVKAYAVWCPTSNETTVSNYQLALTGSPASAQLVTLAVNEESGIKSALTITGGSVTINVSERPVFVMVDGTASNFQMTEKLPIVSVTKESGTGDAGLMIDEQGGDPREPGLGGAPTTYWFPGSGTASAYIDLGAVKQIDRLYLYDSNGTGTVVIEKGAPGSWTPLTTHDLSLFNAWKPWVFKASATSTRYLRFTRTGGGWFNEIMVYGK